MNIQEIPRLTLVLVLVSAVWPLWAAEETALWAALRSGGHAVLIRHALAPGTGDPSHFTLGDCSTQRNLSAIGRGQATRIGARFRANGIQTARVVSSEWCRCLDTATLLDLGRVEALSGLNSFYQRNERREQQTSALKAWLATQDLEKPLVLVTHRVNITALAGVYPASGELVFIHQSDAKEISVIGTIKTQ